MDRWLFGVLTGVLIASGFTKLMPVWQYYLGTTLLALTCCCYLKLSLQPTLRTIYLILGGVFCGIGWGAGNAYLSFSHDFNEDVWQQQHKIEVVITDIPTRTQTGIERWQFSARLLRFNEQARAGPTLRVHWYQPSHNVRPRLGERWRLWVKLKPPQGLRNEGSRKYHRYMLRQGLRATATVRMGRRLQGHASVRQHIRDTIGNPLSQHPFGGILMAISLGERDYISEPVRKVFQQTGLAHLIAISGLHLTLVGGFGAWLALSLLKFGIARQPSLRDKVPVILLALWVGFAVAFVYAWITGFAIATVRALVMWLVVILQHSFGLRASASRVLLRAVVVVLILDPLAWLDAGFWLSVVAVAVIILMNWRWQRPQGRWAGLKSLWRLEWLLTLLMLPVMLWLFQGAAIAAPVTNLLVVPLMTFWVLPLALLGTAVFAMQWPLLGHLLWHVAEWPLQLIWPWLAWLVAQPWHWLVSDYSDYALVLLALWVISKAPLNIRGKTVMGIGLVCLLLSIGTWQQRQAATRLTLHVVDVGQGTAVIIERGHAAMLIDTGMQFNNTGSIAKTTVLPLLNQRKLKPELAFVTHTDMDHIGGMDDLAAAFPELDWRGASNVNAPLSEGCRYGQQGSWREVDWQVLHPQAPVAHDDNNASCVLLLQFGAFRMLFPGDAERLAEATLVGRHAGLIQADVLLVPHHGSRTSSTEVFLTTVKPSLAIFSRARNSRYNFPHQAVLERYQKLGIFTADTAIGGHIKVISDGRNWRLEQPYAAFNGAWYDRDN